MKLAALVATAILSSLFASPLVAARDAVGVTVPEAHVGDLARVELAFVGEDRDEATFLLETLASGSALDAFGREQSVDAYLVRSLVEEEVVRALECRSLLGSMDTVRKDLVYYEAEPPLSGSGLSILDVVEVPLSFGTASAGVDGTGFGGAACPTRSRLAGITLAEGDRIASDDAALLIESLVGDAESEPARATTFHGRDALSFAFAVDTLTPYSGVQGAFVVTLADGLPAPASMRFEGVQRATSSSSSSEGSCGMLPPRRCAYEVETTFETVDEPIAVWANLTAYLPGEGPALAPVRTTALAPAGASKPYDPLAVDDAGFGLAFPFAEAMRALRADVQLGLPGFLARNPDAFIARASYSIEPADAKPGVSYDGEWRVTLASSDERLCGAVQRVRGAGAGTHAGLDLPTATRPTATSDCGSGSLEWDPQGAAPSTVPDSRVAAASVAALGLPLDQIRSLEYYWTPHPCDCWEPRLQVSNYTVPTTWSSEFGGASFDIDPVGGVEGVLVLELEVHGIAPAPDLAPLSGPADRAREDSLALLSIPGTGTGLGVATAATVGALGLALALALKFLLLPLYTRLRRDRLLDDPVRARLHALVRADPGIHLAALVAASGAGDGGTRHHLAHLVKARLLVEEKSPGFTRYFVAGDAPPDAARRIAALRSRSTARVHEVLAREPGLPLREIAKRVGKSAPSVHRDVKRLRDAGLLPPRAR